MNPFSVYHLRNFVKIQIILDTIGFQSVFFFLRKVDSALRKHSAKVAHLALLPQGQVEAHERVKKNGMPHG